VIGGLLRESLFASSGPFWAAARLNGRLDDVSEVSLMFRPVRKTGLHLARERGGKRQCHYNTGFFQVARLETAWTGRSCFFSLGCWGE
jgi:hypothetical protein